MVSIAPFSSLEEHRKYTAFSGAEPEEGSCGFKIFDRSPGGEETPMGYLSFKFVQDSAYLLQMATFPDDDPDLLQGALHTVLSFFEKAGLHSVVFPIQSARDRAIAKATEFDEASETLFVKEFCTKEHEHTCTDPDCSCHHHEH